MTRRRHAIASATVLAGLLAACGGQTSTSGTTSDAGSHGSPDSGRSGPDATHMVSVDGATCARVPANLSTACNVDSDCSLVSSGEVCDGQCDCGGDNPVGPAGFAVYEAAIKGITSLACPCVSAYETVCLANVCQLCKNGPQGPECPKTAVDAGPPADAVAPSDAAACVDIQLSSFNVSCQVNTDCTGITTGEICTGACACGGSAINVADEAKYASLLGSVKTAECPCATFPVGCSGGTCVVCTPGGDAAGCPGTP